VLVNVKQRGHLYRSIGGDATFFFNKNGKVSRASQKYNILGQISDAGLIDPVWRLGGAGKPAVCGRDEGSRWIGRIRQIGQEGWRPQLKSSDDFGRDTQQQLRSHRAVTPSMLRLNRSTRGPRTRTRRYPRTGVIRLSGKWGFGPAVRRIHPLHRITGVDPRPSAIRNSRGPAIPE